MNSSNIWLIRGRHPGTMCAAMGMVGRSITELSVPQALAAWRVAIAEYSRLPHGRERARLRTKLRLAKRQYDVAVDRAYERHNA